MQAEGKLPWGLSYLAYRYNFRYKVIPWASIEAFRIARDPRNGVLRVLVAEVRGSGPVLVMSIVGTMPFVGRVIDDIEEFRGAACRW